MRRKERKRQYQKGWSGGYTEYRYGERKPVSLAGNANRLKPIYRGEERKRLINRAIGILKTWELSPFEHEASVWTGIRQSLCLKGHGWTRSDFEAWAIVDEALRILGAARPTWVQGQPEYVVPRENCRTCGGDLDFYRRRALFCSSECAKVHLTRSSYECMAADDRTRMAAHQLVRYTRTKARACAHCGSGFHPLSETAPQRFCSKPCMYAFRDSEKAAMHAKVCEWCGGSFVAKTSAARFCKPLCQLQESRMRTGRLIPKKISPPVFDYVFHALAA